ncbi:MAG TPA: DUF805 domain-containing protein [Burkholderiaceae bacterium]
MPHLARLSRRRFWLAALATWLAFFALRAALPAAPAAQVPLAGATLALQLALMARRHHDRDRSAWWLLVLAVPLAGALWTAWDLGCRRGTAGANRFGADPLAW